MPFSDIPHYQGPGKLVYGKFEGIPAFVLYGTNYISEGRPSGDIVFGVHVIFQEFSFT
jgi:hypothetical protein